VSLDDPEVVRAGYASEAALIVRASVYQGLAGPDARETAVEAVPGSQRQILTPTC
jgi:hypothetical protein